MTREEASNLKRKILQLEGTVTVARVIKIDGVVLLDDVIKIINEEIMPSDKKQRGGE